MQGTIVKCLAEMITERFGKDKVDSVHQAMTQILPNARLPRFEYEWRDDKTLIMKYHSHRGLIDFAVGLAKGVGNYYKEDLKVIKLGSDRVEITFP